MTTHAGTETGHGSNSATGNTSAKRRTLRERAVGITGPEEWLGHLEMNRYRQARRLTNKIRTLAESAATAYDEKVWVTRGYDSWEQYCNDIGFQKAGADGAGENP